MNYPIYDQEHAYKCEDMMRYLIAFPQHTVYLLKPRRAKHDRELRSKHFYPGDGLSIELQWEMKSAFGASRLSTMEKLLHMQSERQVVLLDYSITRFSIDHAASRRAALDSCTRNTFYSEVLQHKERQAYTHKEYALLEQAVKEPCTIPAVFFDILQEEVAKALAFEQYYKSREKNEIDSL